MQGCPEELLTLSPGEGGGASDAEDCWGLGVVQGRGRILCRGCGRREA